MPHRHIYFRTWKSFLEQTLPLFQPWIYVSLSIMLTASFARADQMSFNQFLANVPILYLPKASKRIWFSGVFRGYKIETLVGNGLKNILNKSDSQKCKPQKDQNKNKFTPKIYFFWNLTGNGPQISLLILSEVNFYPPPHPQFT